ncbi:hypothetical protein BKA69DRAFT_1088398 [Paraphysoderma sedebokerense]|nr:hypothetical protein BKA69DRAFT_1088398 [Paraphysoderma sedebokerense]
MVWVFGLCVARLALLEVLRSSSLQRLLPYYHLLIHCNYFVRFACSNHLHIER